METSSAFLSPPEHCGGSGCGVDAAAVRGLRVGVVVVAVVLGGRAARRRRHPAAASSTSDPSALCLKSDGNSLVITFSVEFCVTGSTSRKAH